MRWTEDGAQGLVDCGSAAMGLSSAGRRKSSSTRLPPCAQRATLWEALGTSLSVQGEREKGFEGEEEGNREPSTYGAVVVFL